MANLSLSIEQQRKIERVLNTWTGKVTWKQLVERIDVQLDINTSRQTLDKYDNIKAAYNEAKTRARTKGLSSQEIADFTKKDVALIESIKRLEAELGAEKVKTNQQLLFIHAIIEEAQSNPLLLQVLQKLKRNLNK